MFPLDRPPCPTRLAALNAYPERADAQRAAVQPAKPFQLALKACQSCIIPHIATPIKQVHEDDESARKSQAQKPAVRPRRRTPPAAVLCDAIDAAGSQARTPPERKARAARTLAFSNAYARFIGKTLANLSLDRVVVATHDERAAALYPVAVLRRRREQHVR